MEVILMFPTKGYYKEAAPSDLIYSIIISF